MMRATCCCPFWQKGSTNELHFLMILSDQVLFVAKVGQVLLWMANRRRIEEVKSWADFFFSCWASLVPYWAFHDAQIQYIGCIPAISLSARFTKGSSLKTWKALTTQSINSSREDVTQKPAVFAAECPPPHYECGLIQPLSQTIKRYRNDSHACKRLLWSVSCHRRQKHHAESQGRSFFQVVLSSSYLGFQGPVTDLPIPSRPFRRGSGLRSQAEQANSGNYI